MHSRLDVEEDRNIRERNKMSSSSGVGVDGMGRGRRKALPDGQVIMSTHTAIAACEAHIFSTLQGSLLSIGILTNAGLTAIYTSDAVTCRFHCLVQCEISIHTLMDDRSSCARGDKVTGRSYVSCISSNSP
jgi:hypothetical protein